MSWCEICLDSLLHFWRCYASVVFYLYNNLTCAACCCVSNVNLVPTCSCQICHASQSRPAEAALLTALLAHDPKRRPAIDDVLRSGLLRKLHAGLTKKPPAASTPPPRTPSTAPALASPSQPAAAAAAGSLQHLALSQQRQQATATTLAQQPAAAPGKSAAVPAAALAAHLGSGGVLQDFLQLARESVATDASQLSAQISILDQVRRHAHFVTWLTAWSHSWKPVGC
jgi:hypothetical protein